MFSSDANPKYKADKTVNIYACNTATKISIIDIEKARRKDKLDPNQFLNINIRAIKLIKTIWPAEIFAYNLIISENGLIKTPNNSIGAKIIFIGMGTPGIQKICFQ